MKVHRSCSSASLWEASVRGVGGCAHGHLVISKCAEDVLHYVNLPRPQSVGLFEEVDRVTQVVGSWPLSRVGNVAHCTVFLVRSQLLLHDVTLGTHSPRPIDPILQYRLAKDTRSFCQHVILVTHCVDVNAVCLQIVFKTCTCLQPERFSP